MDLARGSQVHARVLRRQLDRPGRRHLLVTLFAGRDHGLDPDLGLDLPAGRLRRAGFDPRAVTALRSAFRQLRPDVAVAHGSEAFKYAIPARTGDCLLVYYAIGVVAPKVHQQPTRALYRWMCRRADMVAGVSHDVADECRDLLSVPPDRLVVAPNGRDPRVFHPGPATNGRPLTLAFIGHLVPEKRPHLMLEVTAALRRRGLTFRAVMVGGGPLITELQDGARAAGVEMLGVTDDVPAVLQTVDVLLFPSGRYGEGMPGVLIEAGLAGVPVVATSVPGVCDVVEDGVTGTVVPDGDLRTMVDATAALLVDGGRRSLMGHAARRRCESMFSLAASAAAWDQAIDHLLETRGRARLSA